MIGPVPTPAAVGEVNPVMSNTSGTPVVDICVSTYPLLVTSDAVVGAATPVIF